jgi:hypothetical protein
MTRITDEAGLHPKYHVAKVFDPDHKHDDCFYFVLDLTHDGVAQSAVLAYSDLIARTNPVLASDLRRAVHEARKAALPHLTDDGAVSPPADPTGAATPTAAERATPASTGETAPSSPHLEGATPEAPQVIADAIETLESTGCVFWACEGPDVPFEQMMTCKVCSTIQDLREAVAAGAFREGATPAIDRDQLAAEVEPWLRECGSCDAALPMACTCPPGDYRSVLLKVWRAYEALTGGAS